MKNIIQGIEKTIQEINSYFLITDNKILSKKPLPNKWSKKEILGHLIDSAINNLKRFLEIQYTPQPYELIGYAQNELVNFNHYQDAPVEHLASLWTSLNQQIVFVIANTPPSSLTLELMIKNEKGNTTETVSLAWLITDYLRHLNHHAAQITS